MFMKKELVKVTAAIPKNDQCCREEEQRPFRNTINVEITACDITQPRTVRMACLCS